MEVWSFVATSVEEGTVAVGRMRVEGVEGGCKQGVREGDTGEKTREISSGEKSGFKG